MSQVTKEIVCKALASELVDWKLGRKQFTVANQFDEHIIETALANFHRVTLADCEEWKKSNISIMDIAHSLSNFEAPELESAWVD